MGAKQTVELTEEKLYQTEGQTRENGGSYETSPQKPRFTESYVHQLASKRGSSESGSSWEEKLLPELRQEIINNPKISYVEKLMELRGIIGVYRLNLLRLAANRHNRVKYKNSCQKDKLRGVSLKRSKSYLSEPYSKEKISDMTSSDSCNLAKDGFQNPVKFNESLKDGVKFKKLESTSNKQSTDIVIASNHLSIMEEKISPEKRECITYNDKIMTQDQNFEILEQTSDGSKLDGISPSISSISNDSTYQQNREFSLMFSDNSRKLNNYDSKSTKFCGNPKLSGAINEHSTRKHLRGQCSTTNNLLENYNLHRFHEKELTCSSLEDSRNINQVRKSPDLLKNDHKTQITSCQGLLSKCHHDNRSSCLKHEAHENRLHGLSTILKDALSTQSVESFQTMNSHSSPRTLRLGNSEKGSNIERALVSAEESCFEDENYCNVCPRKVNQDGCFHRKNSNFSKNEKVTKKYENQRGSRCISTIVDRTLLPNRNSLEINTDRSSPLPISELMDAIQIQEKAQKEVKNCCTYCNSSAQKTGNTRVKVMFFPEKMNSGVRATRKGKCQGEYHSTDHCLRDSWPCYSKLKSDLEIEEHGDSHKKHQKRTSFKPHDADFCDSRRCVLPPSQICSCNGLEEIEPERGAIESDITRTQSGKSIDDRNLTYYKEMEELGLGRIKCGKWVPNETVLSKY